MQRDLPEHSRPFARRFEITALFIALSMAFLLGVPTYLISRVNHGIIASSGVYQVDLKELGNFSFDESSGSISDIPPWFRALDGKQVAIEGFILSNVARPDGKFTDFVLVYNRTPTGLDGGCMPQAVQQRIYAHLGKGDLDYTNEEIRAIGTLHVILNRDNDTGKIMTVYTMDVKRVEPL